MVSTRSTSHANVKSEIEESNLMEGPQEGDSTKFDLTKTNVQMLVDERMREIREEHRALMREEMTTLKTELLQSLSQLNLSNPTPTLAPIPSSITDLSLSSSSVSGFSQVQETFLRNIYFVR
jgi:hypothetical protein